jgi:DnaJ-class molecular chaperone with C-terminal Zn finger domain
MQQQTTSSLLRSRALGYNELKVLAGLILEETDHYTVLGVDPRASSEEINQSYCLAVTHFHPLNHRAAISSDTVFHWLLSRAFTRLGIAHRILSSTRRREIYDRSLKANQYVTAHSEPDARIPEVDALNDEERLKLQSYSFATPEWLLAKQRGKEAVGKERRRVVRVKMHIPVVVTCENHWQETGETRDLSPLGAKIALSRRVEPGTLLHLQLRMPKQFRTKHYNTENYVVDARVLRVSGSKESWTAAVEFI